MSSINLQPRSDASFYEDSALNLKKNEVDLLYLFSLLWRGKKFIIATVILFAVCGFFISALLPQKWTSQAEITPAEKIQWAELQRALMTLQVLDVKSSVSPDDVYNLFLKKFASQSLKEEFLATSPLVLGQLEQSNLDQYDLRRALALVAGNLKITNNDKSGSPTDTPYASWSLSFTAPKAVEAQQVLTDYINFITAKVVSETLETVRNDIELRKNVEKNVLEMDRARIANAHEAKLKRLNYSLEVANAAGIKRPVYSNGQAVQDDPDFSIALGADGISEKLRIEQSMKDFTELNADFRNREYHLAQLEKVNIKDVEFSPFKYQLSPSFPMKKDGPGKAIVIALAIILGGIISSGIVLLRHGMQQRKLL